MNNSTSGNTTSDFDASAIHDLLNDLQDPTKLRRDGHYEGFDNSVGDNWIYPTNYAKREYQYAICKKALYHNTLVVLPTGLGKTFIASVVMYNIYRWYPKSKIIFMAPARPLVAQQINACYDIMGIPKEDTVEVTGRQTKKKRHEWWASKRVFFATPQAVLSDLLSPNHNFPIHAIKLVVIDEAHKAKGKYAYTQVIQMISERNKSFRVLALTATPGRDLTAVREVVQNLLISHIEVRYENSIDVAPYTFKKKVKTEFVRLDERIRRVRGNLIQIIQPYIETLQECNLVSGNVESMSKGWLIMQHNNFKQICVVQKPPNYQEVSLAFNVAVSLFHSLELLERHGIRMFMNSLVDPENQTGYKYFVARNQKLRELIELLKEELDCNEISLEHSLSESMMPNDDFYFGHPKFDILERKLLEHFAAKKEAKAMIFSEFRETVYLIEVMLRRHKPLIRSKKLVGQGSGSGVRTVTQKEQLVVMKEFKSGRCNCLIATCVAEEGIDVGDIDLIVCFDSTSNPTRYVQRIGRTGRKQVGNVLMLLTEGKEYESWKNVVEKKDKTNQKLSKSKEIEWVLYKNSPRLVPPDFDPQCLEICLKISENASEPGLEPEPQPSTSKEKPKTSKIKKPPKIKAPPLPPPKGTDLRNFFKPVKDMGPVMPVTQAINETEYLEAYLESSKENLSSTDDPEWQALRQLRKVLMARKNSPSSNPLIAHHSTMVKFFENLNAKRNEWDEIKENLTEADLEQWKDVEESIEELKLQMKLELHVEDVQPKKSELQYESQFEYPELWTVPDIPNRSKYRSPVEKVSEKPIAVKSSTPIRNEKLVLSALGLDSLDDLFGDDSPEERKLVPETLSHLVTEDIFDSDEASTTNEHKKIEPKPHINHDLHSLVADNFFDSEDEEIPCSQILPERKWKPLKVSQQLQNLVSEDLLADTPEDKYPSKIPIKLSQELQNLVSPELLDSEEEEKVPLAANADISNLVDLENIFNDSDDDLFAEVPPITKTKESIFSPTQHLPSPSIPTAVESLKFTARPSIFSPSQPVVNSAKLPTTPVKTLHFTPRRSIFSPTQPQGTPEIPNTTISTLHFTSDVSHDPLNEANIHDSDEVVCGTPQKESKLSQFRRSRSRVEKGASPKQEKTSPSVLQVNKKKLSRLMLPPKTSPSTSAVPTTSVVSPSTPLLVVKQNRKRRIVSDSDESPVNNPQTPTTSRRRKPANKKPKSGPGHCSFLDIEAGVSEDDDTDETDDDDSGSIHEFVVENETVLDETHMHARYLQSLKSPLAGGFKIPQLKEFRPEEIYSQPSAAFHTQSQYDVDGSFCVDEVEEDTHRDMSQLELAEMILEAERKSKKRRRKLYS